MMPNTSYARFLAILVYVKVDKFKDLYFKEATGVYNYTNESKYVIE